MESVLRILHLEDDPLDTDLVQELLSEAGLAVEMHRVDALAEFEEALERESYALILSDYSLPGMDPLKALRWARQNRPEVPFVFVSGTLGEEAAIETLKMGATDYVLKQRMQRLVPAVRRAIHEADERTRLRQTEAALKHKNEELQELGRLLDLANAFVRDEEGRITHWSSGCQRLYGFTAAQALGRVSYELLKTRFPEPLDRIKAALQDRGRWEGQLAHRRADGGQVVVASVWVLYRNQSGRPLAILEVNNDITEQKRLEEELASVAQFSAENPQPVLRIGREGQVLYANKAAETLLEREGWEHHGLAPADLREPAAAALIGGSPREFEFICQDQRVMSFLCVPVPDKGYANLYGRDVTETRRAEEALRESDQFNRSLIDSSLDCIKTLDLEGNLLSMSEGGQKLLEISDINRWLDSCWIDFWRIDDRPHVQNAVEAARAAGVGRFQAFCPSGSGRPRWWDVIITPIRGSEGKVERLLAVSREITEQKQAEEKLRQRAEQIETLMNTVQAAKESAERAKALAEEASRAKDQFLAVLSHELRTPLTPVVTAVSMLQKHWRCDEKSREMLEMIHRNVEMEARLIDDLLDVTRITRGKIELDRRPVPLCEVIRSAVEVCKPDIEARQLHFGVDIGPSAPYLIHADAARLQQVFWNLLKNAIKFTPHGGCVGIRCRLDDHSVVAEVMDSGEGIDPTLLPHIFNPFEQGGTRVTQQFGGLGLGLTITKGLVDMHGGTISAHSEGKGKGATFRVRLPIHVHRESALPSDKPDDMATGNPAAASSRSLRILLVEDHGDTAKIMRRLLIAEGHAVETAGDVATALELAESRPFDLLLSDLGLPDGSGVDLMRELRRRGHTVPGIALSGYGQEEDVRRTREIGFAAHLTKPIGPGRLAETIAVVSGQISQEQVTAGSRNGKGH